MKAAYDGWLPYHEITYDRINAFAGAWEGYDALQQHEPTVNSSECQSFRLLWVI